MAEVVRSIVVAVEIDTNKRTIAHRFDVDSIDEAVERLREVAEVIAP